MMDDVRGAVCTIIVKEEIVLKENLPLFHFVHHKSNVI
jgi:hypothetical protein